MNIIRHYEKEDVAFDLDSVLNTLAEDWFDAYNKEYNDNLTTERILTWDTHLYVKPECGKKIYEYLARPHFFRHLGVQPGAQEIVQWLVETDCFNLYVATAYSPITCLDKSEWIQEFFPMIDPRKIIFINDKGKLNIPYLIDDGPHNIMDFNGTGIVYDYPYNRNITKNHVRITDLLELKEFFSRRIFK